METSHFAKFIKSIIFCLRNKELFSYIPIKFGVYLKIIYNNNNKKSSITYEKRIEQSLPAPANMLSST